MLQVLSYNFFMKVNKLLILLLYNYLMFFLNHQHHLKLLLKNRNEKICLKN